MRVNNRGGYDVLIRDAEGRYLAGSNVDNPTWVIDEDNARAGDDDEEAMETAAMYELTDDDGNLKEGYELVRIPWVNPDLELDERFIDPDTGDKKADAIRSYVFGDGPIDDKVVLLGRRRGTVDKEAAV